MMIWKMIFLFNWVIFRFHVNLPGCRGLTNHGCQPLIKWDDPPSRSWLLRRTADWRPLWWIWQRGRKSHLGVENQHKVVVFRKELYLKGDYMSWGLHFVCVCVCCVDSWLWKTVMMVVFIFLGEGSILCVRRVNWNFILRSWSWCIRAVISQLHSHPGPRRSYSLMVIACCCRLSANRISFMAVVHLLIFFYSSVKWSGLFSSSVMIWHSDLSPLEFTSWI